MGLGQGWRSTATSIHAWSVPAIIAALCLLTESGGDAARVALRFDRTGIGNLEFWRLLTGHITHLGWWHLLLNLAGLALVWLLIGDRYRIGQWCLVIIAAVAGIDLGLWFGDPQLDWYVGLSGLLHGLLAAGVVAAARRGSTEAWFLGILLVGKLLWEQLIGPMPGSSDLAGAAVVVDAHLYGALAGAVAGIGAIRDRGYRSI